MNLKSNERKCDCCGKTFLQRHDEQFCCCVVCLVSTWDELPGRLRTRAKARRWCRTLGYRSISEVKYQAFLDAHGIESSYETDTFKYDLPRGKYTPDFKIIRNSTHGTPIYLEYKGVFSGADRRKMRYVRKSNPNLDIRLVFERPCNKLNRLSKTTYAEWATKNKFKWYDAQDLDELLEELEKDEQ